MEKKTRDLSKKKQDEAKKNGSGLAMGLSVGLALGVVIGSATKNLALWMSLGACWGVCVGVLVDRHNRKQNDPGDGEA